jgi:hypothetical protein
MDFKEIEIKQKKRFSINSVRHLVMGILFLVMSAVMFFAKQFNLETNIGFDANFRYLFGGICLLYGAFRVHRGCLRIEE